MAWFFFCLPAITICCLALLFVNIIKHREYFLFSSITDQRLICIQAIQLLSWLVPYKDWQGYFPIIIVTSVVYFFAFFIA
jgi:hypothetical protein